MTEMKAYVALLRAVNVGGTGKLPMPILKQMCEEAGFTQVRTYIASGNVVFKSNAIEAAVKALIEASLHAFAGKPVGVMVRSVAEMLDVVARNPYADEPGNRSVALFVDDPIPADALDKATGVKDERFQVGKREIYIFYGAGQAASRLAIPAGKAGTARNMNTVATVAKMANEL